MDLSSASQWLEAGEPSTRFSTSLGLGFHTRKWGLIKVPKQSGLEVDSCSLTWERDKQVKWISAMRIIAMAEVLGSSPDDGTGAGVVSAEDGVMTH